MQAAGWLHLLQQGALALLKEAQLRPPPWQHALVSLKSTDGIASSCFLPSPYFRYFGSGKGNKNFRVSAIFYEGMWV
jgi:hypothetical protein